MCSFWIQMARPGAGPVFWRSCRVRWVNFARVSWGELERRPPARGQHTYHWSGLDEGVRQWQRQGVHIMMSLRLHSPWGTAKPTGANPSTLRGCSRSSA